MQRWACLVALMALASPASARDSYSFSFRGHDIHVEAGRHCRSLSCVSVSVDDRRSRRDQDEVAATRNPAPAVAPLAAPAPAPVQTIPSATRAQTVAPSVAAEPAAQPLPVPAPLPPTPPPVQAPVAPPIAPTLASAPSVADAPPPPPIAPTLASAPPAPAAATPAAETAGRPAQEEADADTPIGDWKTEGLNNLVRIESCGRALCGYVLDAATHSKGETVLINMKPKSEVEWTGNVYSRASGNSYYGRIKLKDARTLRVEACALGSFFCSGNNWTRLEQRPAGADELISSQAPVAQAHS